MVKKMIRRGVLIGVFILWGIVLAVPAGAEIEQVVLTVDGLACPFCAYGLEKKIVDIPGVASFEVELEEGKVYIGLEVAAKVNPEQFRAAVKEAGFTLRAIEFTTRKKISR